MRQINLVEGKVVAPEGMKVGIVAARFNEIIVNKLLGGAVDGPVSYTHLIIHTLHNGIGAFCRRDTGGCIYVIHCHGKCCTVIVRVLSNHRRKVQSRRKFRTHRCTDKTLCIGRHEINIFPGCKLCRTYQISLIFSVRIICDQNYFSFLIGLYRM